MNGQLLFCILSLIFAVKRGSAGGNLCLEIGGCYCTNTSVKCDGADLALTEKIFPYVTPGVVNVELINSNIQWYPDESYDDWAQIGPNVVHLNLARNQMTFMPMGFLGKFPMLSTLDLSDNNFFTFDWAFIHEIENHQALVEILLHDNPWDCTCAFNETLNWLKTTDIVVDSNSMICAYAENSTLVNTTVIDLTYGEVCTPPEIIVCWFGGPPPFGLRPVTFYICLAVGLLLAIISVMSVIVAVVRRRRRARRNQQQKETEKYRVYPNIGPVVSAEFSGVPYEKIKI